MSDRNVYEEEGIDPISLIKAIWNKAWIVVIAAILLGAIFLSYAVFFVPPQYQSSAMMYVNNSYGDENTSFTIGSSELTAAKNLLEVYIIILKTQITLESVIEAANLDYTYEELYEMVEAESVNGTEVFRITASCEDPAEATLIVNTIVEILPSKIAEVVKGGSVTLVDYASYPTERSSPSYIGYALFGVVLGLVLSCSVIIFTDIVGIADEKKTKI